MLKKQILSLQILLFVIFQSLIIQAEIIKPQTAHLFDPTDNIVQVTQPSSKKTTPSPIKKKAIKCYPLRSQGRLSLKTMVEFLIKKNPYIIRTEAVYIASLYQQEANQELINYDLAFAQMLLETNFLRFGNQVLWHQNNFAGIGALDEGGTGHGFEAVFLGVRGHIQHLKAYATKEKPNLPVIDPRYYLVKKGIAPCLSDLSGRWATDRNYAMKIKKILARMYKMDLNFKYSKDQLY